MRKIQTTVILRAILFCALFGAFWCGAVVKTVAADTDPLAAFNSGPAAIEFEHFPSRLHTFIWRNWPVVPSEKMAELLGTSVENVNRIAATMGLPAQKPIAPTWKSSQGYITVLRRNWHLLPYPQILQLLDVSAEELAESLQEDDFLFIKLGSIKPQCEPLRFTEPTEEQNAKAAKIAQWVRETLGEQWNTSEENRFEFLNEFFPKTNEKTPADMVQSKSGNDQSSFELRYLFSYFATFGDPLLDPEVKSYPDELLRRLAEKGANGVWLHTVLRTLAPSERFPEFGKDHEIRLQSLRTLVQRANRYGIKVYLYVNEPRTMPVSFFQGDREALAGVNYGNHIAMCTSTPEVRQWLSDSISYVFKNVPGLGGIFTITASENRTNCTSHYQKDRCPRCKDRTVGEIIGEVNTTLADAVHSVAPEAKVLNWDWGWADQFVPEIIEKLPDSAWLMSVSEWSLPIDRGGVKSNVGEYSISSVGPGPRATRHWELARKRGLKTVAKVQFNVTWELAAVPYVPVADLIAEHAANLSGSGVNGLMLSWSLGGWPSPNLEIAQAFQGSASSGESESEQEKQKRRNEVLDRIAQKYYGDGAEDARRAWTALSNGYREYPYHIGLCYSGPQQWGAANLVYPKRTGYVATMVGIPYDAVNQWCAIYTPQIAASQFRKVADGFRAGIPSLEKAVAQAPQDYKNQTQSELRFAQAALCHFAASANMIEFNDLRNRWLDSGDAAEKAKLLEEMKTVLGDELQVAQKMYEIAKSDSRIGYESSNHYFYLPIDIAEAIVSIKHFLDSH